MNHRNKHNFPGRKTKVQNRPGTCQRQSRFTLVELLAALAVLSVMMMVLLRFSVAANELMSISSSNMRVYQSARAVMDLIEQDVKGIVLSTEKDAEIGVVNYPVSNPADNGKRITFVSAVGESSDYASELVELTYSLTGSTLQRTEIGDDDPANWNFLGKPAGWETGGGTPETVISGVTGFEMTVDSTSAPKYVQVKLTLVDDRSKVTALQDKTKRSFTKTIYLNQ